MKLLADDLIKNHIVEKMQGNMVLAEGETEAHVFEEYFTHPVHFNWVTESNAFVCCMLQKDHVFVPFAWRDTTHTSRKEIVELFKFLYDLYTKQRGMPVYYTGSKNFYSHHSISHGNNVWEFVI